MNPPLQTPQPIPQPTPQQPPQQTLQQAPQQIIVKLNPAVRLGVNLSGGQVKKPSTSLIQQAQILTIPQTSVKPSPLSCKKTSVTAPQSKHPNENQSSNVNQPPSIATPLQAKKTIQVVAEDLKNTTKTIPSLSVVVRPSKALPEHVNQKKREALGNY